MRQIEITGWVIMTEFHPVSGKPFWLEKSFSRYKHDAIKTMEGYKWSYWKKHFGYKAVNVTAKISIP